MILRKLLLVLGVLELLRPKRVVDFWMDLATTGDVETRRWVYTAARLEGIFLILWALTRGRCGSDGEPADESADESDVE
ncbi:hypothetical protein G3I44_13050 [Halogeometricum borinquense]|uniref:Uncharacterized protein n=1 Tax=Halogeometricum borinquense TaxID=60847 RepID=A0A6C0UHY4_9EURY|nr:hypothetical protein [Halogeometricum borinquense]QIB75126.1 hypothetical protein G3I44_13050 [Halogeometricum borinquense]